jgi:GTP-binding protein
MALLGKAAVPFTVVLTKGDLVHEGELEAGLGEVRAKLARRAGALPEPLSTSSRKARGIDLLRADLAALASHHRVGSP